MPTLVCSGNHDLDHRTESGEKATRWLAEARGHGVHVDGDSFDLGRLAADRVRVVGGPGDARRARGPARRRPPPTGRGRWLWAFHGPPEGPLSWTGSRHYGDPELPRLLETYRPDVVLCGHIHQAPFTDEGAWAEHRGATWLFNAGYEPGARPTFIELDLGDDRASWWSAVGRGEVDLNDPSTAETARLRRSSVVGRAVRARLDVDPRADASDPAEQLAEHAEVVVAIGELALDVDDVRGEPVRAGAASWRATSSPSWGWAAKNSSGSPISRTTVGATAVTVALRGWPSSAPISPTNVPGVVWRFTITPPASMSSSPSTSTHDGGRRLAFAEQGVARRERALGQALGQGQCVVRHRADHRRRGCASGSPRKGRVILLETSSPLVRDAPNQPAVGRAAVCPGDAPHASSADCTRVRAG